MPSYTYELPEQSVLLSVIRQNLLKIEEDWEEVASFLPKGHVEYQPIRTNPMKSGYRYVYEKAKLNLTLYFPEQMFNRLLELLDGEKLEVFKAVVQSALPRRSGYVLNEFKIRGVIGEDSA